MCGGNDMVDNEWESFSAETESAPETEHTEEPAVTAAPVVVAAVPAAAAPQLPTLEA
jgi:hypothetical protein